MARGRNFRNLEHLPEGLLFFDVFYFSDKVFTFPTTTFFKLKNTDLSKVEMS